MAPVNPNALNPDEYAALARWAAMPVGPQPGAQSTGGLAAIAGGTSDWRVPAPQVSSLARLAADIADNYDYAPVAAYSRNDPYVSMPGSREAWEQYGVPPVMIQSDPYATAAYRAYTDPYGQIGVQPLIGFPSRYPHVLSGVPSSPFRELGFINALLPSLGFTPMYGMGRMQQPASQPQPRVPQGPSVKATTPPAKTTTPPSPPPATPAPVVPQQLTGGPYDETTWRDPTMPVPPAPALYGPMTQTPPELGGNVNTLPEAYAAGHPVAYPDEFTIDPQGDIHPIEQGSNLDLMRFMVPPSVRDGAILRYLLKDNTVDLNQSTMPSAARDMTILRYLLSR